MSPPFDRSDRGSARRGVWTHWVPLAVTLTVATVGLAAWAWSQRRDDGGGGGDDDDDAAAAASAHEPGLDYENADYGDNPPYGATSRFFDSRGASQQQSGNDSFSRADNTSYGVAAEAARAEANANAGWGSQMSGALRRTPSPQQFLSSAGKTVAAGVGAVGAAMGSALAAIREEDKNAYKDHETWSEEAESRKEKGGKSSKESSKRRKTVAVIVSADTNLDDLDEDSFHEHAVSFIVPQCWHLNTLTLTFFQSILSHIPRNTDFSKIKLFVLIYAPNLKDGPLDAPASNPPPASLSSSYSNIGHEQAQIPGEESKNPLPKSNSTDAAFNAVYSQALSLVEKESMVMPFTSASGHTHILRHLQPEVVFLQESLAGDNGNYITQLQTWLPNLHHRISNRILPTILNNLL